MAMLYADLESVKRANDHVPYMGQRVNAVKRYSRRLRGQIPDEVRAKCEIGQRLKRIDIELEKLELQITELYEVTDCCVEQYAIAERRNSTNAMAFC